MSKRIKESKLEGFMKIRSEKSIPTIVQDKKTGLVLMMEYSNEKSFEKTMETGYAAFWCKSRNVVYTRGEYSGNLLRILEVLTDSSNEALIYRVKSVNGKPSYTDRNGKKKDSEFYLKVSSDKSLKEI